MGLFDNLYKRHYSKIGYKDSIYALSDNLYLLLNRERMQKLFMMSLIAPDRKTRAGGDD